MSTNPRVITGPFGITTAPTTIACAGCSRPVLAATVGGVDRHIDPTPLTDIGELAALLAGRATYDLAGARGDHLIRRTHWRITAGRHRHPVLADHRCQPTPPAHIDHTHQATAGRPVVDPVHPPY